MELEISELVSAEVTCLINHMYGRTDNSWRVSYKVGEIAHPS